MNKTMIIIMFAALLVIVSFSAFAYYNFGAGQYNEENNRKAASHKKSCCTGEEVNADVSENSIYQLDSKWTDQSGTKFSLSELKGKKVVLSMIFANCTYACPLIVNDMKKVENSLSDKEKIETEFVLVSIDPERDTPETLNEYAKTRGLDLDRWKLLTGSQHNIRELAALLGFKYKKDEKGDYSHSNLINVLSRQGDIVYQHEGLNKEVDDIAAQLYSLN